MTGAKKVTGESATASSVASTSSTAPKRRKNAPTQLPPATSSSDSPESSGSDEPGITVKLRQGKSGIRIDAVGGLAWPGAALALWEQSDDLSSPFSLSASAIIPACTNRYAHGARYTVLTLRRVQWLPAGNAVRRALPDRVVPQRATTRQAASDTPETAATPILYWRIAPRCFPFLPPARKYKIISSGTIQRARIQIQWPRARLPDNGLVRALGHVQHVRPLRTTGALLAGEP